MMDQLLYTLNKTPGVLGSAWIQGEDVVFDMGEAVGGAEAAPVAQRAVEACRAWMRSGQSLDTAVFTAERGRLLLRVVGDGMLVVFTETDAAAGMVKVRMREIAGQMATMATTHG